MSGSTSSALLTCSVLREYFYAAFSFFFPPKDTFLNLSACLMFIDRGHVKLHIPLQEQKGDHSGFSLQIVSEGERCAQAHMDLLQEDILLIPSTSILLTFFSSLGNLTLSPVVIEHLYPFLSCFIFPELMMGFYQRYQRTWIWQW